MTPTEWWEFSRRIEAESRAHYEGGYDPPGKAMGELWEAVAQRLPAQIEQCRIAYDNDGNPAHVWEGIMCACTRARYLRQPLELPSWIAAYLGRASQDICGGAVGWPVGDRRTPNEITVLPDGSRQISGGPGIVGVTPEQRRDALLDALGFRRNKGASPLVDAHRLKADKALLRKAEFAKQAGQRVRDIVPTTIEEPHHKLKRARRRVRRVTGENKA